MWLRGFAEDRILCDLLGTWSKKQKIYEFGHQRDEDLLILKTHLVRVIFLACQVSSHKEQWFNFSQEIHSYFWGNLSRIMMLVGRDCPASVRIEDSSQNNLTIPCLKIEFALCNNSCHCFKLFVGSPCLQSTPNDSWELLDHLVRLC